MNTHTQKDIQIISLFQAEQLLTQDGDFLVRHVARKPGQFVLSSNCNGFVKHLLLVDPEGVVSVI